MTDIHAHFENAMAFRTAKIRPGCNSLAALRTTYSGNGTHQSRFGEVFDLTRSLFDFIERFFQLPFQVSDVEPDGSSAVEGCDADH